jgi:hypothetical protein
LGKLLGRMEQPGERKLTEENLPQQGRAGVWSYEGVYYLSHHLAVSWVLLRERRGTTGVVQALWELIVESVSLIEELMKLVG